MKEDPKTLREAALARFWEPVDARPCRSLRENRDAFFPAGVRSNLPLGYSKMLKAGPQLLGPWQKQRALREPESFLCPLFAGPSFLSVKAMGMNQVS